MIGGSTYGMTGAIALAEASPLRRADPRTKLAICLCASLAVMLPLEKLVAFFLVYSIFITWARLLPEAVRQVWKLKWILGVLFLVDWIVVSPELAVAVTLRLVLMAGVFAMFFSTTTPSELCCALVWLRVPYRYAFSIGLSFQAVGSIDDEWRGILEAQRARGAFTAPSGWRYLTAKVRNLVCAHRAGGGPRRAPGLGHDRGGVRARLRFAGPELILPAFHGGDRLAHHRRGMRHRRGINIVEVTTWVHRVAFLSQQESSFWPL